MLYRISSGNWKLTTHLLEWPKSGTLTKPNAGEEVEPQELSFITGANSNGTAVWKNMEET